MHCQALFRAITPSKKTAIFAARYFARNDILKLISGGNFGTFHGSTGWVNEDTLDGAGLRKDREGTKYYSQHKHASHDYQPITSINAIS